MKTERQRMSLADQHMNRCVHFNGMQNQCCKAGVAYAAMKASGTQSLLRALPCFADNAETAPLCELQRFPTRAEAEEYEAMAMGRHRQWMEARKRIAAATGGKRGVAGHIACPACGKRLQYSVAGNNGHVWGKCETPHCLAWME